VALAAGGDHFGAMQDAGRTVIAHIEPNRTRLTNEEERNGPPQSAPESHLFRTGPAAPGAQHDYRIDLRGRPSLRACGRYSHDFVSVSDHLGSIRRVGCR